MIDASTDEARGRLAAALGARRWVDEVAAAGPYDSLAAMIETGDAVARTLTDAELDEALTSRPDGGGAAGAGASELGRAAEGVDAAIARGASVYEERFGRTFLIRIAGRSRKDVLDELQRRLKNDPQEESAEAKDQLRQIAALRLESLFEVTG